MASSEEMGNGLRDLPRTLIRDGSVGIELEEGASRLGMGLARSFMEGGRRSCEIIFGKGCRALEEGSEGQIRRIGNDGNYYKKPRKEGGHGDSGEEILQLWSTVTFSSIFRRLRSKIWSSAGHGWWLVRCWWWNHDG